MQTSTMLSKCILCLGMPYMERMWFFDSDFDLDFNCDFDYILCSGGPYMDRIWFFDFDTRTWSSRITSGGRDKWTFGHAIKRGRYMYAYGTHHLSSTEESTAVVRHTMCKANPKPPLQACVTSACLLQSQL